MTYERPGYYYTAFTKKAEKPQKSAPYIGTRFYSEEEAKREFCCSDRNLGRYSRY